MDSGVADTSGMGYMRADSQTVSIRSHYCESAQLT